VVDQEGFGLRGLWGSDLGSGKWSVGTFHIEDIDTMSGTG